MVRVKNDLLDYGLKIYQDTDYFKFSIDSVLLAEFVNVKLKDKTLLDFCCGNAPLLLILKKKSNLTLYGMELQKNIYDLALQSVLDNNLDISLINDDVKNCLKYFPEGSLDIITCNPSYFKCNEKNVVNDNYIKAVARHEICINFEEIVNLAYKLLKVHGYFYFVHRTDRLIEIIDILAKNNFSIKTLKFVYESRKSSACCVLFECVKDGKTQTYVDKPLFINNYLEKGDV